MPDWFTTEIALAYLAGCMTAATVYMIDWFWQVKILPKKYKEEYPPVKTVNAALKEKERRDRDLSRERTLAVPSEGQMEPEVSSPLPVRSPASPGPDPMDTEEIEEALRLDTADLPTTQEHPAPRTALIDFRNPPPQPATPYRGPERRLRSDNPYPELRRRTEDREAFEASVADRKPPPAPPERRMTRAEERRLREGLAAERKQSDTDGE